MIDLETKAQYSTAVRAWVEVNKPDMPDLPTYGPGWRSAPFGQRVLCFDTETTTDYMQQLLFGFFQLYEGDVLIDEAVFIDDDLDHKQRSIVLDFAREQRIRAVDRTQFVEETFFPEVYGLGTLCGGYNLPFDFSRIAIGCQSGEGKNSRRFTFDLAKGPKWPRVRIEQISTRGAFIAFAPKTKLGEREKPFFGGRFLDLSTLTTALTGEHLTLRSAGIRFGADVIKSRIDSLGKVTKETLTYGRRDVAATWALYKRLRAEYMKHPFATVNNEFGLPTESLPITRIWSGASIAKQYLRCAGYRALLDKQPNFDRRYLGYAAAAYFGGRAEVRVRRTDVPVRILDFTSMYPTVFILQDLQRLLAANEIVAVDATARVQAFLAKINPEALFEPSTWKDLNCLIRIRPNGETLPVRFKILPNQTGEPIPPFGISVTPFASDTDHWYTIADILAAIFLGKKTPQIIEAIEFRPNGQDDIHPIHFRGDVEISPGDQIFKVIVEQRNRAKDASKAGKDADLKRLDLGLKQFAASGSYGIYFEVNVIPDPKAKTPTGTVYSDGAFPCTNVGDERPGSFCNPIVAAFITGAARLMLALLETEVRNRGGNFAFCDTDSLAIIVQETDDQEVPGLIEREISAISAKFNRLNPYETKYVPNLLKFEYDGEKSLRCYAVSAKRYVLFTITEKRRLRIIKASESGMGGIIGRTPGESTKKLARRIWTAILIIALGKKYNISLNRRLEVLTKFEIPLRRKMPLGQPRILKNSGFRAFNRWRRYATRIKPFGFIQIVSPAVESGDEVTPIAPYERSYQKSRDLPWVDLATGRPIALDWANSFHAGTVSVTRMDDFIKEFGSHPESKAAGPDGRPSTSETRGLLGRLHIVDGRPERIGKEVDRLEEDDGILLGDEEPFRYLGESEPGDALSEAIERLDRSRQSVVAATLGISVRRWRDISKRRSCPRASLRKRIVEYSRRLGS